MFYASCMLHVGLPVPLDWMPYLHEDTRSPMVGYAEFAFGIEDEPELLPF